MNIALPKLPAQIGDALRCRAGKGLLAWILLLLCAQPIPALAACSFQIGTLTATPTSVSIGATVSISIPINYKGCRNTQLSITDNNPIGVSYSSCSSADTAAWNCLSVTTTAGVTSSSYFVSNNGIRAVTLTFVYSATSTGASTVTLTASPSSGSQSVSFTVTGAPTVTTDAASGISGTAATLNGTVSSNGASSTVTFEYGLTTSYGSTAAADQSPLSASANATAVSYTLAGLTCATTYQFRATGVNSHGTTNGSNQSFTTPSCGPDHYELSLPTNSISCLPTTVMVTACADSSNPCSSAYTAASGTTATLATSGATLGSNTVTFNASGVATTSLSYPSAAHGTTVLVTLSGEQTAAINARQCCENGTNCSVANSCPTTFNTAGFIVSTAAGGTAAMLPTQTAGTASNTYYLRAVQTSTTTAACTAALTGATTVNWAYECNNPSTCSSSNLMSINGGTATPIARNNNASVSSYAPVTMNFDASGNAPFTFTFDDVGQATLWVNKTVNSATLSGASNALVTKPAGFAVSGIAQTASPMLANPAATSSSGAKFITAGESFSATVTAQTSGGAATPNYGKETSPEGVLLSHALVLPGSGAAGALSNGSIAGSSFSSGLATVSNLAWSEVGIIALTPSVGDGSYLGVGDVVGSTSNNIGRFIPARFALSATSVTQRVGASCTPASSFTYLGENFQLGFTLTAQNTSGATTTNYQASFAKLDPTTATSWQLAGIDGSTVFSTGGAARLSLGSASGNWINGVAAGITLSAAALRAATPDGPFNAVFGIAPSDSDGVLIAFYDLDTDTPANGNERATVGTVPLRFGRLRLSNSIGAHDRDLGLPVRAQYWDGSVFATNFLDSCTLIPDTAVNFGNYRKTITNVDTVVAGSVTLANGSGTLVLAKPTTDHRGTVDVALSLGSSPTDTSCLQPWTPGTGDAATQGAWLSFLRGAWCSTSYDKDPCARASFGLYRGADNMIYQRENY